MINEQQFIEGAFKAGLNPQQVSQAVGVYRRKNPQKSIGGFLGNVVGSGAKMIGDTASAVFHPVNTAKSLVGLGSGIIQLAIPGEQGNEKLARAVGQFYVDRYGSLDKAWNSFYTDPVGVVSDASIVLGGAGGLLKAGTGVATRGAKVVSLSSNAAKVARLGNTLTKVSEFTNPLSLAGKGAKFGVSKLPFSGTQDALKSMSASLATKSLRPSPSQQAEFLEATGKSIGEYSRDLGLQGSGSNVLSKTNKLNKSIKGSYNALTRSGKMIDPTEFINQLRRQADAIVNSDFSTEAQQVAKNLRDRADLMESKSLQYMIANNTDTIPINILTDTKSSAYSKVPTGAMSDPTIMHAGKEAGRAGVTELERLAPGSRALGKEQQAALLFQEIAQKQAGLGKGTQLINAFKPAGYGSVMGGIVGGGIPGAVIGGGISVLANDPRVLAMGSKALNKASQLKVPQGVVKATQTVAPFVSRVPRAAQAVRSIPQINSNQKTLTQPILREQNQSTTTYSPPLPQPPVKPKIMVTKEVKYSAPKSVFTNKSSFGKTFRLKPGSFN